MNNTATVTTEAPETALVCPVPDCDGGLQLTRKDYWSLDADGDLHKVQDDQPDLWHLYCANDHNLDGMDPLDFWEANHGEVAQVVRRILGDYKKTHGLS